MRPHGRHKLDSLYFEYPEFSHASDIDRNPQYDPQMVNIVGAGPIGLTAALTLAKYGIRSIVLERKNTFNDGSRAICIARQSFHIFERIDTLQPFLDKALGWTMGRSFYRGRPVLEFEMPDSVDEKFRPMYNLQQQYIEQFLWHSAVNHPLIEIRWQCEVTGIEQHADRSTVEVRDPQGTYSLRCHYVLAADGARSTLRELLNLRLKGENHEGRYVIADVQMDNDYPTIRRALFDPDCRRGGTVLVHKQPDNIWRIDYQLHEHESAEAATEESNVRAVVAGVLRDIGHEGAWDLEWWSVYSANTLALDEYRHGNIFFVGDSAHIVPIFGVRGLNNGLADAQNIGWKLAWVMRGRAHENLLESYSVERRGATMDVFANAIKSTRFMTPPTTGWKIMRDAALSLALTQPFAGKLANPRQMTPYIYDRSPITCPDDGAFQHGPKPGAVMNNRQLPNGFLSDLLADGFSVVVFGDTAMKIQLEQQLEDRRDSVNIILVPADTVAAFHYDSVLGTVYVVRPDMHIAGRWKQAKPQKIVDALHDVLVLS